MYSVLKPKNGVSHSSNSHVIQQLSARRKLSSKTYITWFACLLVNILVISFIIRRWQLSPPGLTYTRVVASPACDYQQYILGPGAIQDDPCLIQIVRDRFMIPPTNLPYNIERKDVAEDIPTNIEKFSILERFIINKNKPGFFIECGANDGEFISPTLRLEKTYNWTGLLIEANPDPFSRLVKKNRKAWLANVAACITPFADKVSFFTNPKSNGLAGLNARKEHGVDVRLTVQCLPLYTMLKAINVSEVDYLSLDVEGMELEILKTVPFEKIRFKFLTVEHGLIPGRRKALQEFLESRGYFFIKELIDGLTTDSAYAHESMREKFKSLIVT